MEPVKPEKNAYRKKIGQNNITANKEIQRIKMAGSAKIDPQKKENKRNAKGNI